MKRTFKVKYKPFFLTFKGLSLKQMKQIFFGRWESEFSLQKKHPSVDQFFKNGSFMIHRRNILKLSIELFKAKSVLSSKIMNNSFEKRQIMNNNLSSQTEFLALSTRTSHYGLNFLRYFAAKVWHVVLADIKHLMDLDKFNVGLSSSKIICFKNN